MAHPAIMIKTFALLFLLASSTLAGIINDPGFRCSRNGPDEIVCESLGMTESKRAPQFELYPLPNGGRADVARGWVAYLYPSKSQDVEILMRATRDGVHWIASCQLPANQTECHAMAARP